MIRPCSLSSPANASSFAFEFALIVERAVATGGAMRMTDLSSKPDQIRVKGISFAAGISGFICSKVSSGERLFECEPETATQAMHMRVHRKNIPPQCKHQNTCGGLCPYPFEPGKFLDDILIRSFSKGGEIVIAVRRVNGAEDSLMRAAFWFAIRRSGWFGNDAQEPWQQHPTWGSAAAMPHRPGDCSCRWCSGRGPWQSACPWGEEACGTEPEHQEPLQAPTRSGTPVAARATRLLGLFSRPLEVSSRAHRTPREIPPSQKTPDAAGFTACSTCPSSMTIEIFSPDAPNETIVMFISESAPKNPVCQARTSPEPFPHQAETRLSGEYLHPAMICQLVFEPCNIALRSTVKAMLYSEVAIRPERYAMPAQDAEYAFPEEVLAQPLIRRDRNDSDPFLVGNGLHKRLRRRR